MIYPYVRAAKKEWINTAYSFVYYSKLKSNLNYIARQSKVKQDELKDDLNMLKVGNFGLVEKKYGKMIFMLPTKYSDKIKFKLKHKYSEIKIKDISVWKKKGNQVL